MMKLIGGVRFIVTLLRIVRDPNRLDLVFKLADSFKADDPMVRKLLAHPVVRRRLDRDLPIPTLDLARLRALPDGTLGREIARFFDDRGFDPAALYHTDSALATDFDRFKRHMERTHDIWHVVTGFGTDVPGEIGLQAFGLAQVGTGLPYVLMAAGMLHQLRDDSKGEALMNEIVRGWQLGKSAQPFFGVDWEALYPRPLADVRAQLGITPAAAPRVAAPAMQVVAAN